MFVSMLVCDKATSGDLVHYIYEEFECWTGMHIIHAAFGVLGSVLIVLEALVISLTYYKPMGSANDASTKINSRADTFVLIEKIILAVVFQNLRNISYQWVLIVLISVLSFVAFLKYYTEQPYHNESIGTTFNFLSAVFAWANTVLLISKILEESAFNGSLQMFFLGIPLIFALIVFKKDERVDNLMLNVSNFLKGEEVMEQVRYFMQLVSKKDSDRNSDIILKGYVFQHEDSCPNEQCQLKQYKQSMINTASSKSNKDKRKKQQHSQQSQLQMMQNVDNQQILMQHAKNMYRIGIQKFPTNSYLRIAYAFFLIEKMNKKQEALAELNAASLLNPPFDEQFIIFRYKKLSEEYGDAGGTSSFASSIEDRSKQNSKSNMDLMAKFAYESNFRQLSIHIERCAQYHLEFWNQLREERPDVAKLGESGQHINQSITHVDNIWNSLQKLNSNVPKALRLYGKYLMEILHDKDGGIDLLQRAKDAANVKHNYYDGAGGGGMLEDLNDIQYMSSDGTPCIYVSGDLDKIGMITQSNAGATRIFGYQPLEIRNHNVEKLMPEMYAKNHSKVLEDALMKGPENIPNKERLVFARHKSGYIFPVWLQLKMVQNISNGVQFVAMFKVDKKLMSSNIGFILLNKEKKIQGISSSCMRLMNLDLARMRRLTGNGYDLNKLAPSMFTSPEEFFYSHSSSKQGVQVEWNIPKFERNKNAPRLPQMGTLKAKQRSTGGKDLRQGTLMNSTMTNNQGAHQDQDTGTFSKEGRSSIKFGLNNNNNLNNQLQSYTVIDQKFTLNVSVNNIVMGELGEIGWYLRIDGLPHEKKGQVINEFPQSNAINEGNTRHKPTHQQRERVKQPLFQFRYDGDSGRFVRELKESLHVDNAIKDPNFIDGNFATPNYIDFDSSPKNGEDKEDQDVSPIISKSGQKGNEKLDVTDIMIDIKPSNEPSKDSQPLNTTTGYDQLTNEDLYNRRRQWARGIQIYRLLKGKFVPKDGDEETKKEKQIEDERKKKLHLDETNLLQLDTFKTNIKSRKALHMAINDTTVPPAIRNLKTTMNLVIVCLLALAITEFIIITAQFKDINENFNLIQKSYGRVSEVQRVAYDVRSLILINEGKLKNLQRLSKTSDFTNFLKSDIELALNQIYELQNYISLSTLSVSQDHQKLLESKVVPLYYKESNTTFKILNFSLTESVLQISSAIFTVRHLNMSEFYELQEDVYFVTYNVFNDFLFYLRMSSDYYLHELTDRSNEKNRVILILFLCSIGLVILSLPILFPAVSSVNKAKIHVLSLFLDIPNNFIIDIANKCESFLNQYHDDQQMDEMQSEDDEFQKKQGEKDSSKNASALKRGIHKQAKNTAHTNRNFFLQFSFAVFAILAYFIAMFILANDYISDIEILSEEMKVGAQLESYFAFAQNTQRELLYNPQKKILNSQGFNVSKTAIEFLFNQTQNLLNSHQSNRNILDQDYQDKFHEAFNSNQCNSNQIRTDLLPQSCNQLFNNASQHGLETVLAKYYETLRESLQIYKQLNTNVTVTSGSNKTQQTSQVVTLNGQTYRTNQDLVNSQLFVDLYLMQFRFIQETFRNLVMLLKNAVNQSYNDNIDTRMATFIIYILVVVLAYLILWTPFLGKLNREIWRTKSMLTIIPIEIIMKIPKIQEYLNRQAMFNNKKQTAG